MFAHLPCVRMDALGHPACTEFGQSLSQVNAALGLQVSATSAWVGSG